MTLNRRILLRAAAVCQVTLMLLLLVTPAMADGVGPCDDTVAFTLAQAAVDAETQAFKPWYPATLPQRLGKAFTWSCQTPHLRNWSPKRQSADRRPQRFRNRILLC